MSTYRKDGSLVLPSDSDAASPQSSLGKAGYNPVTHDTPAPGGIVDHTAAALHSAGDAMRKGLMKATGADKIAAALEK